MRKIKIWLATIVLSFGNLVASAYDFSVDGISYNVTSETDLEVEVAKGVNRSYVKIPESVTNNGITYSVTSIGDMAFDGSYNLNLISIPSSVIYIGINAFSQCTGLTDFTLPPNLIYLGEEAFAGCDELTSITIPSSVNYIGCGAFTGCYNLSIIKVEQGNTIYDSRNDCNAIINTQKNELICGCSSTIIPNNVISIGENAFDECVGLTSITIPNSVINIGEDAFCGCEGLTSVTIPNSVTSIGDYAFEGCENLISVTSKAKNPPTLGSDVFDGTPVNNLYVPIGSKSAYEAASGWDWFENIVEMEIEIEEVPIVSANDVNIVNDGVTWLSINMENKKSILGFQFKLTLPDGIVVDTDKNGKLQSVLSSRCNGFTLGLTAQGDNNYKVDCISLQNKEITGTEGELVKIKLTTNGEVAVGNSTITLSDIKLTTTEGTETITLYPANYTSKIAVLNYNLGDVDGKDGVSVTDAVMVVQDMFYKTPSNFIRETADVNGDGRIDGSDVVCILDILRTSSSKTQKGEWLEAE